MDKSRLQGLLLWIACAFFFLQGRAQVNADAAVRMGRNALSADDYIAAVRYFNHAIDAKPFLAAPYYYRAYAKFTLEDFVGAEKDCDLSIERNPFIADVYRLRAICRIHNENYEGAVNDYVRVIAEEPNDQGVRYNQALCFLQLKRYEQADSALQTLMTPPDVYVRAFSASTQSRLEQKDTTGAIVFVDKWLTYVPKDFDALPSKHDISLTKKTTPQRIPSPHLPFNNSRKTTAPTCSEQPSDTPRGASEMPPMTMTRSFDSAQSILWHTIIAACSAPSPAT